MDNPTVSSVYEISISARVTWQAHSLSNSGNNGSNRLMSRRQLLADGTETDACSGSIAKHHHAALLLEYAIKAGLPVCPACKVQDGRRAAALPEKTSMQKILTGCCICDTHGFLITGKNGSAEDGSDSRQRLSKSSLVEYAMTLALPGSHAELTQTYTRSGEGQMIIKIPARSGEYAVGVRYRVAGIGVDTETWQLAVEDSSSRQERHAAILFALRDQLLSPDGALTAKLLPHLTGIRGVIAVKKGAGRAPIFSALVNDFTEQLQALEIDDCEYLVFENIAQFSQHMKRLANGTAPVNPSFAKAD